MNFITAILVLSGNIRYEEQILIRLLLINILTFQAISYANCLTCYSDVLGTTGTVATATCSTVGQQACYVKIQNQ